MRAIIPAMHLLFYACEVCQQLQQGTILNAKRSKALSAAKACKVKGPFWRLSIFIKLSNPFHLRQIYSALCAVRCRGKIKPRCKSAIWYFFGKSCCTSPHALHRRALLC